MSTCPHKENPAACDHSCLCHCDECQERYEAGWHAQAAAENLCDACGVPQDDPLTVDRLKETQYIHFYDPCPTCKPRLDATLAAANLCPTCRDPLPGTEPCVGCTCTGEEQCPCRQCKAYRESRSRAWK